MNNNRRSGWCRHTSKPSGCYCVYTGLVKHRWIKAQVLASDIYQKDSGFYQAMELGTLETVGLGWQKADEYVAKINKVTAEQVRDVARKYLLEDHLSIAYLEPQTINTTAEKKGVK